MQDTFFVGHPARERTGVVTSKSGASHYSPHKARPGAAAYPATHNMDHQGNPTMGPDNPSRRDLSIGVFIVTHTPEGMGQYTVPGIRLHMMKGDAKGMPEDDVVLKVTLRG